MIPKILEFSKDNLYISKNRGFLEVKENDVISKVALDQISGILFTGFGQVVSCQVLSELSQKKIPIIFCNKYFIPESILLPVNGNRRASQILSGQVSISIILKKNLWKEIIKLKILSQGQLLKALYQDCQGVISFSTNVLSGDKDNKEAQASKRYWSCYLDNFQRNRLSLDENMFLNYGYTILRSAILRGIVASGLNPSLGLFHKRADNPFVLADDLIEPFRVFVDFIVAVYEIENDDFNLSPEDKKYLVSVLNFPVFVNNEKKILNTVLYEFCYIYIDCIKNKKVFDFKIDYKKSFNEYLSFGI